MSKPPRTNPTDRDADATPEEVAEALKRIEAITLRLWEWHGALSETLSNDFPRMRPERATVNALVRNIDWIWKNQYDRRKGSFATVVAQCIRILEAIAEAQAWRDQNPLIWQALTRGQGEIDEGQMGLLLAQDNLEGLERITPDEWKRTSEAWRGFWTTPRGTPSAHRYNAYSVLFSLLRPHDLVGRSATAKSFQRSCQTTDLEAASAPPARGSPDLVNARRAGSDLVTKLVRRSKAK